MANIKKRGGRTTQRQYDKMVTYIADHKEMILGRLSSTFTVQVRHILWEELASSLNADFVGPKKTVQKWRKTWNDLKCDVKAKAEVLIKVYGGEPPINALSPLYRKVAILMGIFTYEVNNANVENESKPEQTEHHLTPKDEPLSPLPEVHSPSAALNGNKSEVELERLTASIEDQFEVEDWLPKVVPLITHATGNSSSRTTPTQQEDDNEPTEPMNEKNPTAEAIMNLAFVMSRTNDISEKRLQAEQERNRLIQQRNEIERNRNNLIQSIARAFFPNFSSSSSNS